jgi:hypothetical protein
MAACHLTESCGSSKSFGKQMIRMTLILLKIKGAEKFL